jgi:hypothetical protein
MNFVVPFSFCLLLCAFCLLPVLCFVPSAYCLSSAFRLPLPAPLCVFTFALIMMLAFNLYMTNQVKDESISDSN